MFGYRLIGLLSSCILFCSCISSSIISADGTLTGSVKIPYSKTLLISHCSDHSLVIARDLRNAPKFVVERYNDSPSLVWSTTIPFDSDPKPVPIFLFSRNAKVGLVSSLKEKRTLRIEGRQFNLANGKEEKVQTLATFTDVGSNDLRTPYHFLFSPDSSLFAIYLIDYAQATKRGNISIEIHTFGDDFNHIKSDTLIFNPDKRITSADDLKRLYFNQLSLAEDSALYAFHCYPADTVELWRYNLRTGTTQSTRFTLSEANFNDDLKHITGMIRKSSNEITLVSMLSNDYSSYSRTISQFLFARIDLAKMKLIDAISLVPEYDQIRNSDLISMSLFPENDLILATEAVTIVNSRDSYEPIVNWNDLFVMYCDSASGLRWRERVLNASPTYLKFFLLDESVELFYTRSQEKPFAGAGIVYTSFDRETGAIPGEQRLVKTDLPIVEDGVEMIEPGEILCVLGTGRFAQITHIKYSPF